MNYLQIPVSGPHSIVGRAVVVHADPDDLGRGESSLFDLLIRVALMPCFLFFVLVIMMFICIKSKG